MSFEFPARAVRIDVASSPQEVTSLSRGPEGSKASQPFVTSEKSYVESGLWRLFWATPDLCPVLSLEPFQEAS